MRNLYSFLNEQNVIDQSRYYIVPKLGEEEYKKIIKAEPIAFLDGLLQVSITTRNEPIGTKHTSLEKTASGWVVIYKKEFD